MVNIYVLLFILSSCISVPSRPGKLPMIRPMSPDKVLREQPPVKPMATSAMLPLDCSEIRVSPPEAPIILSLPRTGKADYYELTWKPRHDGGVPMLEYVIKYRKVSLFFLNVTFLLELHSNHLATTQCYIETP